MKLRYLIIITIFISLALSTGCSQKISSHKELMENTCNALKNNSLLEFEKVFMNKEDLEFFQNKLFLGKEYREADEQQKLAIKEEFIKAASLQKQQVEKIFKSILESGKNHKIDWSKISYQRYDTTEPLKDPGLPIGLKIIENPRVYFTHGKQRFSIKFDGLLKTSRGWVLMGSNFLLEKE